MGFTKLFDSIWSGSLYGKFEASAVFMVFLSLSDADGQVDLTPEAIAGRTGWPLDFIQAGITQLEAPDARSRTPDADGRRIILIDSHRPWGWFITNHAKYREEQRSCERREYLRLAKKAERDKKRQQLSTCQPLSTAVNLSDADADADADAEIYKIDIGIGCNETHSASTVLPPTKKITGKKIAGQISETKRTPRKALIGEFSLTDDLIAYTRAKLPNVDGRELFQQFKDHHLAKATTAADWPASWRTWVRNALKFGYPKLATSQDKFVC